MAELPQIPGASGPPQIPGGSEYSAGRARIEVPKVPITPGTVDADRALPSTEPIRRKKRILGPFRIAHLVIAVVIAIVGLARSSSEVKTPKITVPKIDVPKVGDMGGSGGSGSGGASTTVPAANVYRAAPGSVAGHSSTIIELGVRGRKIRWVAATGFPRDCSDGTRSSGLILYSDEGKARGSSDTLRYEDENGEIRATFRLASRRGTLSYDRSGLEVRCAGSVTFRAARASKPLLAQGMLDADRRAAEAFGG